MWRTFLSMGLMFGAMAWSALALIIIFLIIPALWETLFGPDYAAFGAMGALVLVVWGSVKMMGLADRLSGMSEGRVPKPGEKSVEPDLHANWQEYNAAIARNKRWAFYRRTHQFDRLRELELETQRAAKS